MNKNCPFCDSKEVELRTGTRDREGIPVSLVCSDCGAAGPWAYCNSKAEEDQIDMALELWNSRGGL